MVLAERADTDILVVEPALHPHQPSVHQGSVLLDGLQETVQASLELCSVSFSESECGNAGFIQAYPFRESFSRFLAKEKMLQIAYKK